MKRTLAGLSLRFLGRETEVTKEKPADSEGLSWGFVFFKCFV
jgi:hypothetical protein